MDRLHRSIEHGKKSILCSELGMVGLHTLQKKLASLNLVVIGFCPNYQLDKKIKQNI